MEGKTPEDPRTGYLRLKSLLFDRVTGLPSCPAVVEQVRDMVDGRRHVGVLHFQLLDLELVESLYGWQVFDRILARAAAGLTNCLGRELPAGSVLALNAIAGDRLLAFVPHGAQERDVDGPTLARTAGAVAGHLSDLFDGDEFGGLSPRLHVRAGWALLSEDPFYRFERRVQAAIEEARTQSERRKHRRERAEAAELRQILADASLSVVFQPVVDLLSGEVLGHEGFVRGPEEGLLGRASALFQLSGSEGVSRDLDRLARRTVLREAAGLPPSGMLFVNVLPGGLADPEWHDGLARELLDAAGIPPGRVVLEISERAVDLEPDGLTEACRGLRRAGFLLGLDDVGTGFSSLASVERMQPEYLKLDATIVHELHLHLIKQDVVASVLQVAERLGCAVVAEGVETEEEAEVLRRLGARYAQGYLFARPVAAPRDGRAAHPTGAEH
jgi:EAL domain-containing protein (putative c-di-GMP-specific phosphodiesterase class I)/GGDEF domain-containing protein